VNHNGDMETAKRLIDAAAGAGADAVKFQTFQADRVITRRAPKADYQKKATGETETQLEMLKRLELDAKAHHLLIEHCRSRKIQFLSTPFDHDSIDLLAGILDLPCLKIASGEITNGPFLLKVARTGKPVILSTGMSTLGEIEEALGVLAFGYAAVKAEPSRRGFQTAYSSEQGRAVLREKVRLLHCTTEYPAPFAEVNLRAMATLRTAFGLPVGLSDHTTGIAVAIAAVALGASIIEKHFTLDRGLPGPDHQASLEPAALRELVYAIRQVEKAMGNSGKQPSSAELRNREAVRKSLFAASSIHQGEPFSADNVAIKRPGNGLSPLCYWDLLGRKADRDYETDEMIGR